MRIDFSNDAPTRRRADAPNVNAENKSEIFLKKACNYAENFVPLHCQKMKLRRRPLRIKIARIKSRNCAH